jgi:hypothetical protein
VGSGHAVLIWTHTAGSEVHVRGTAQVHTPRSGMVCKGWVLPPGVAPPVPYPGDRLMWALTTTGQDRADSYRVTVKGGQCADGDYWALRAGGGDVWKDTADPTALGYVGFRLLMAFLGGGLLVATWRAGRRILRGGT